LKYDSCCAIIFLGEYLMNKKSKKDIERLTRESIAKKMLNYFLSLDFIGNVTKLERDIIIKLRQEIIIENDVFRKCKNDKKEEATKFVYDPFMTFFLSDDDCVLIDSMEKSYYQMHYPEKVEEVRKLLGVGMSVDFINDFTKIPEDVIESIKNEVNYD